MERLPRLRNTWSLFRAGFKDKQLIINQAYFSYGPHGQKSGSPEIRANNSFLPSFDHTPESGVWAFLQDGV